MELPQRVLPEQLRPAVPVPHHPRALHREAFCVDWDKAAGGAVVWERRALPHAAVGPPCPAHTEDAGRLLGNMLQSRAPASTGILASSVKWNRFQLHSEGDTDLGPVFTRDASSYGPTSRIAPRTTESRQDLQRISRSTIVDQQQTFIALYMWCCSRHCGTG